MKNVKLWICKKELNEIEKLKEDIKKLKKENKKLKIQNQFKDDLISAISHEFKNPITIINGYIETILKSNIPPALQKKFLEKIEKNTLRLNELINRLYLVSKLEKNKFSLQKSRFRLDLLIKDLIKSFDEERFILNLKKVEIYADKELLQIVISNLISNAIKYSKNKITINLNEKTFEIIDKGIGIDKDKIELITQKFYRIAKNDWDNSLGLGLYIVKKILKLHNTKLLIESEKKKGSKFYFDITSLIYMESLQQ